MADQTKTSWTSRLLPRSKPLHRNPEPPEVRDDWIILPTFPTPEEARSHLNGWLAEQSVPPDHRQGELQTLILEGGGTGYRYRFRSTRCRL